MSFVVAALVCWPLTSMLADCRPLEVDGGSSMAECRAQRRRVLAIYRASPDRPGVIAACRPAAA